VLVEPPRLVPLPDGRTVALDDVGDPAGLVVVYLHGTPDSRLARHPDDRVAAAAGVRLLAVDRPGAGASDAHPAGTLRSLGADVAHVLDALEVERAALLGWSAGGLAALAAATVLGDRAAAVGLVGTVPPVEAYADPAVRAALGPTRRPFAELALELSAGELAEELAPYLVPDPITAELALAHVLEGAGERGRAELGAVPGAADQMARALLEAVRGGTAGLVDDIAMQLEPGLDLTSVRCRVRTFHGSEDPVSPPEVGHWLAERLPEAVVEVVPDGGHHLHVPRWRELLSAVVGDAGGR
jgi:pimeloyl-ACP methyl ester carboxylesterase